MTRNQEDKIIGHAREILERRLAVENDIKIDLRKVAYYGAYYQGAMVAIRKLTETMLGDPKPKGDDWIYIKAQIDLATSSKRNMQLYLDGTEMRYRNHTRDKKGKLKSCQCYYVENRSITREII